MDEWVYCGEFDFLIFSKSFFKTTFYENEYCFEIQADGVINIKIDFVLGNVKYKHHP